MTDSKEMLRSFALFAMAVLVLSLILDNVDQKREVKELKSDVAMQKQISNEYHTRAVQWENAYNVSVKLMDEAIRQRNVALATQKQRATRGGHRTVLSKVTYSSANAWANSAKAIRVANCESGGNPRAVSSTGKYRGKWQMDASFWRSYGGLAFASRADLASEWQQDVVAWRGFVARGWQPWSCA